ncbi:MAG: hypothetical protein WD492_05300 [Alkalispirochaeta sp.]
MGDELESQGVCEQIEVSEMGVTMPALADPLRQQRYRIGDQVAITGYFRRGSVRTDEAASERVRSAARTVAKELHAV